MKSQSLEKHQKHDVSLKSLEVKSLVFLKLELLLIIKFGKLQCYIVAYQCSIWEMSARPTNLN